MKAKTIGQYLRTKRIQANLTQRDLADKLALSSAQYISNIERDICVPSPEAMKVWVKYTDAKPRKLINFMVNKQREKLEKFGLLVGCE